MAEPTNIEEFKAYIFRRLGWPVIQVNVDDEQATDRIMDALAFYQDYHYLGSEKSYYIHTVTAQDVINGYITLPETVLSVYNILPSSVNSLYGGNWMTHEWQYMRDEFFRLDSDVGSSLIPYYVAMMRIADLDFLFGYTPSFTFNKHKNRIYLSGDLKNWLVEGNKLAFETQAVVNPQEYSDIWKDRWLKKYATALMKRQWAENLKLYSNVPLLNGITLDAQTMFQEAVEELTNMEEKLITSGNFPVLDQIG